MHLVLREYLIKHSVFYKDKKPYYSNNKKLAIISLFVFKENKVRYNREDYS